MTDKNMQGKVCLVTGSSSGIGKVTARELAKLGATVVMICRNRAKGLVHIFGEVLYFLTSISEEKGAQTTLYLATSPELERVSGKYFDNRKQIPSSAHSYDAVIRQQHWNVSEKLIRQNELSLPVSGR